MSDRIYPPTCSCYPLALGTVRFFNSETKVTIEHTVARTAVRRVNCEVHQPHNYLRRFVAR